jgi:predicted transcriptional regulator
MCKCGKQNLVDVESLDDTREKKVFNIISKKPTNFTTIKNKAGFHQEITSRILKRLGDKLIVRKTDELYDLCCNGSKLKSEERL